MSVRRVGLVCGYLDPRRDGVAHYTRRLADHLHRVGVEPVVVTTYDLAEEAGGDVVGVTKRWDVPGVAAAGRALRRLELDVVHLQYAPSVFRHSRAVGVLPVFLPNDLPLVVTLHEYGVWSGHGASSRLRSRMWSSMEKLGYLDRETLLLVRRATCLVVTSQEHVTALRARFPRRPPVAVNVPIGLNIDIASGDRCEARTTVRAEFGVEPHASLVAFFGFLHPAKALDRLITAVAELDAHLLLIGGTESHSVPSRSAQRLLQQLQDIAVATGAAGRIHVTGYLPAPEVSRLLQAADVAAFPLDAGVSEKSGSLLAAFAAGVPVVATAPAGEVSAPTEVGSVLRIPPRDTWALTAGLRQVVDDRDLVDRLVAAGRRTVAGHSWDRIAEAHAQIYADVGRPPALRQPQPERTWFASPTAMSNGNAAR